MPTVQTLEEFVMNTMDSFDQTQAKEEGWCISQCIGSNYFPEGWYDIQCWSESEIFDSDLEAEVFVINKVVEGSPYHIAGFDAMENANFAMVREYQKNEFKNQNSV